MSTGSAEYGLWGNAPLPAESGVPDIPEEPEMIPALPMAETSEFLQKSRSQTISPGQASSSVEPGVVFVDESLFIDTHDPSVQDERGIPLTLNLAHASGTELGHGRPGSDRVCAGM